MKDVKRGKRFFLSERDTFPKFPCIFIGLWWLQGRLEMMVFAACHNASPNKVGILFLSSKKKWKATRRDYCPSKLLKVGISVTSIFIYSFSFHLANHTLPWMFNIYTISPFEDHASSRCMCGFYGIIVGTTDLEIHYLFILYCHLTCCLLLYY